MTDCGCAAPEVKTAQERRVLYIALVLNAAMAVIGGLAGWYAQSSGLLADALDMLADAAAYSIALLAIGRTALFKTRAATLSGGILLILGAGILFEVGRRLIYGAEPLSEWMIGTALLSLVVNLTVLRLLAPMKSGEVHLRATWLFTRADVVANLGVILAGVLVYWLRVPYPDYVIGTLIGLYVIKEAIEILRDARSETAE
ncbi:cation diffusion facilitator family transporter [Elongatibacter sediminis]|uniref:Cation diffusion facilitator family transporter n=1 Tax=Elongatibacter sediminis TaxID=3119006 RepID=A0AAW9RMQ5_9GAMM